MRNKVGHLLAGAAVAGAVCAVGGSPGAAFVGAALAGIAKEFWDAGAGQPWKHAGHHACHRPEVRVR